MLAEERLQPGEIQTVGRDHGDESCCSEVPVASHLVDVCYDAATWDKRFTAACSENSHQDHHVTRNHRQRENNKSPLARLINAEVYGYGSRNICLPHHLPMAPLRLKSWMELTTAVMQAPAFRGKRCVCLCVSQKTTLCIIHQVPFTDYLELAKVARELYKEQGMCIIGARAEALKHRQSGGEI
ncbi:hypothetical protein STEG23_009410, partial [Scotinomys teguina]